MDIHDKDKMNYWRDMPIEMKYRIIGTVIALLLFCILIAFTDGRNAIFILFSVSLYWIGRHFLGSFSSFIGITKTSGSLIEYTVDHFTIKYKLIQYLVLALGVICIFGAILEWSIDG